LSRPTRFYFAKIRVEAAQPDDETVKQHQNDPFDTPQIPPKTPNSQIELPEQSRLIPEKSREKQVGKIIKISDGAGLRATRVRVIDLGILNYTAMRCKKLQDTALHRDTLQHIAPHCTKMQHTATQCNIMQDTARHYNTLRHTATHCNTLQTLQDTARQKKPDSLVPERAPVSQHVHGAVRHCMQALCVLQCVAVCCSVLQ